MLLFSSLSPSDKPQAQDLQINMAPLVAFLSNKLSQDRLLASHSVPRSMESTPFQPGEGYCEFLYSYGVWLAP